MEYTIEEYPYSSYHYFLDYKNIPECLQDTWVLQNHKDDKKKAIEALTKIEDLEIMFEKIIEIRERNKIIASAYAKGYSQHMIAKVLGNTFLIEHIKEDRIEDIIKLIDVLTIAQNKN